MIVRIPIEIHETQPKIKDIKIFKNLKKFETFRISQANNRLYLGKKKKKKFSEVKFRVHKSYLDEGKEDGKKWRVSRVKSLWWQETDVNSTIYHLTRGRGWLACTVLGLRSLASLISRRVI